MCGITGFWSSSGLDESAIAVLGRMTTAIRHRGPDDSGCWWDSRVGLALGHRRLSVIALSTEGRQPMVSASGRYVIIFNGEVYNFLELRADLMAQGARFRGESDTEVMLAVIERDGVLDGTKHFAGMF